MNSEALIDLKFSQHCFFRYMTQDLSLDHPPSHPVMAPTYVKTADRCVLVSNYYLPYCITTRTRHYKYSYLPTILSFFHYLDHTSLIYLSVFIIVIQTCLFRALIHNLERPFPRYFKLRISYPNQLSIFFSELFTCCSCF